MALQTVDLLSSHPKISQVSSQLMIYIGEHIFKITLNKPKSMEYSMEYYMEQSKKTQRCFGLFDSDRGCELFSPPFRGSLSATPSVASPATLSIGVNPFFLVIYYGVSMKCFIAKITMNKNICIFRNHIYNKMFQQMFKINMSQQMLDLFLTPATWPPFLRPSAGLVSWKARPPEPNCTEVAYDVHGNIWKYHGCSIFVHECAFQV